MNFKFFCPSCGQRIATAIEDVGTSGQCPTCGEALIVPPPEPKPPGPTRHSEPPPLPPIPPALSHPAPVSNPTEPAPPVRRHNLALPIIAGLSVAGALWILYDAQPSTQFRHASRIGTQESYAAFLRQFPNSEYAAAAKQEILVLKEEAEWQQIQSAPTARALRGFLEFYPAGRRAPEARQQYSGFLEKSWAALASKTDPEAYAEFLRHFPESPYQAMAERRQRELKEDQKWNRFRAGRNPETIRDFLFEHPDSRHVATARALLAELAEEAWAPIIAARDLEVYRNFIRKFPDSPRRAEADRRMEELQNDFTWVEEQNTLTAYRRYLNFHPDAPNRTAIEKKIIDLEVAEIMNSRDFGQLPAMQALPSGLGRIDASIEIENGTSYPLTVRYSGAQSRRIELAPAEKTTLSIPAGDYTIAASVTASRVRSYAGRKVLGPGAYSVRYYISSSPGTAPPFDF